LRGWGGGVGFNVEAHIRANTEMHNKGSGRQEGQEREGKNSGEQRHVVICGRESDGAGYTRKTRWTLQGLSVPVDSIREGG